MSHSYHFRNNLIFIDCEMSGLDHTRHQLLEIAAIKADPKTIKNLDTFHTFVGPPEGSNSDQVLAQADPKALSKNGLDPTRLAFASSPREAMKKLTKWLPEKYIFVGFNLNLDFLFLNHAMREAGLRSLSCRFIDLVGIIELYNNYQGTDRFDDFSLSGVCKSLGIKVANAHTALGDAELCMELFKHLIEKIKIEV